MEKGFFMAQVYGKSGYFEFGPQNRMLLEIHFQEGRMVRERNCYAVDSDPLQERHVNGQ
jgi:hypothetical protein